MIQNKKIIGITGGSGCGKTTICEKAEKLGILVIDADKVARKVLDKGTPAYKETVEYFGKDILRPSGYINRQKLAEIVFNKRPELKMLNKITHKYIWEEIEKIIKNSDSKVVAIDAAVLIESGMDVHCDAIIAIVAPINVRIERIMKRDGLSKEQAFARINSQPLNDFYTQNADYVIKNSGDFEKASSEAIEIIRRIIG